MRRLQRINAYNLIRQAHLLLAISVGVLFVIMGLTGSLLVFDHAVDEMLNPELLTLESPLREEERLDYDSLLERAQGYAVEHDYVVTGLSSPRHAASTQLFWMRDANTEIKGVQELYLHPVTGDVLGQRKWGDYLTSFIYMFHHTLWLGKSGKNFIGYCAIGMMLLLFSGVYVWWPRGQGEKRWQAAVSIKRKSGCLRKLLDLHRVSGIYGLLFLAVVVFSGLYLVFPEAFRSVVTSAKPPLRAEARVAGEASDMTVAESIALVKQAQPESTVSRVYTGDGGKQTWLLTLSTADDPKVEHGFNRVSIDPAERSVVSSQRWSEASQGDKALAWMFPLHSGEAFGLAGRIAVFLSGFLPAVLMVTGIWRWLRKRANQPKRRKAAR